MYEVQSTFSLLSFPNLLALGVLIYFLFNIIRVVNEYERLVIFRLGKLRSRQGAHGPGLIVVIPFLDQVRKVSIRTVTMDVPPQDIITKDNVSLTVNAVVYYKVTDPEKAVVQVDDYYFATSQLAQTALRSVCGETDLDALLSERDTINKRLQQILEEQTAPWGVKVSHVELKNVDLPKEMQRAMGRQAEAERERRAKIIAAEGEMQSAQKITEAAALLSAAPGAMQLRYLNAVNEISQQNSKIIVFPLPTDLLSGLFDNKK